MSQGPIAAAMFASKNGVSTVVGMDAQGALSAAQRHGKFYAAARAGTLFRGANSAGVTLSAALATTYVGICLSNPAGSGVNLSLVRVQGLLEVAPAALTALGLITGFAAGGVTVHTTALAPANAFINGAAPKGKLDSACTIVGTPAWARWFGITPGATSVVAFAEDLDGSVLIPPGGYAAVGASIAGPASGFLGSMLWEELPQ